MVGTISPRQVALWLLIAVAVVLFVSAVYAKYKHNLARAKRINQVLAVIIMLIIMLSLAGV